MNKNRRTIYEKSNGHCWYCGIKLDEKGWHIDHLEPVVRNPVTGEMDFPERDSYENKVPACASCNINKHSLSLETWREIIKGYVTSLNRDSTQYRVAKRYGLIEEKPVEVIFWFEKNSGNHREEGKMEIYEIPDSLRELFQDVEANGEAHYRIIDNSQGNDMDNTESMKYFLQCVGVGLDCIEYDEGTQVVLSHPDYDKMVIVDAGGLGDFYSHSFDCRWLQ